MNNGYQMTFNLTVGAIRKVRLENHLLLLLRLHILFSGTTQKQKAHHTETTETNKKEAAEVFKFAIHEYIIHEFCLQSSSVSKIQPLKFTTFMTSTSRTSGLWGR